jgi:uncharacterized protein YdaU (DUF1376 family)
MPLYVSDYLGGTRRLSYDQQGPYLFLLMEAWTTGGFLPDDPVQLANIAGVPMRAWMKMAPMVLSFFKKDERGLYQERLLVELAKAQHFVETRRQNGSKGGRPPNLPTTESEPSGNLEVITRFPKRKPT